MKKVLRSLSQVGSVHVPSVMPKISIRGHGPKKKSMQFIIKLLEG